MLREAKITKPLRFLREKYFFTTVLGGRGNLATLLADEILNTNFIKCALAACRLRSWGNLIPVMGYEIHPEFATWVHSSTANGCARFPSRARGFRAVLVHFIRRCESVLLIHLFASIILISASSVLADDAVFRFGPAIGLSFHSRLVRSRSTSSPLFFTG